MEYITTFDFPEHWVSINTLKERWKVDDDVIADYCIQTAPSSNIPFLRPFFLQGSPSLSSRGVQRALLTSDSLEQTGHPVAQATRAGIDNYRAYLSTKKYETIYFEIIGVELAEAHNHALHLAAAEYQKHYNITRASFEFLGVPQQQTAPEDDFLTFWDIFSKRIQLLRQSKPLSKTEYPYIDDPNVQKVFHEIDEYLSLTISANAITPYGIMEQDGHYLRVKVKYSPRNVGRKIYTGITENIQFHIYPSNKPIYFAAKEIYNQWPHWNRPILLEEVASQPDKGKRDEIPHLPPVSPDSFLLNKLALLKNNSPFTHVSPSHSITFAPTHTGSVKNSLRHEQTRQACEAVRAEILQGKHGFQVKNEYKTNQNHFQQAVQAILGGVKPRRDTLREEWEKVSQNIKHSGRVPEQ